jgi:hypothetical protein
LLHEPLPTLRSVLPQAPADLDSICSRAMAFRADDRYASVADLLQDLEAHLARRRDVLTLREIGAVAGQAFADERQAMNAAIEEELLRWRRGPSSGVIRTSREQPIVLEEPVDAVWPLITPSRRVAAPTGDVLKSSKGTRRVSFAVGLLLLGASLFGARPHTGKPHSNATAATSAMSAVPSNTRVLVPPAVDPPVAPAPVATPLPKAEHAHVDEVAASNVAGDRPRDPVPRAVRTPQPVRRTNSPEQAPAANCQPPYTIDPPTGMKHWRRECL